jgi:hypothetical protein
MEDLGTDARIIINRRAWAGLMWLRIGISVKYDGKDSLSVEYGIS